MDHIALYRKYRPTKFSQVVGQKDIITILKNSIINKSFAHAYLFSGAKGTGKTSTARILAKVINCESSVNAEACNQCPKCQFINNNDNEIDIIEIDGASNNGVEEIRNIRNNINLLPMNLKYKIYIIDEVHMLTTSAFNALLKTLEEPPKHIIFIFATTEPYKVPETIISRCQWFQFEKINHQDLIKIFEMVLKNEKIKFEAPALKELALLCQGSLRDGINSLEKVVNYSNEITLASVNKLYNIISIEKQILFLVAFFNKDFNQIILLIDEFYSYLSDFKKFLTTMIYLVQDIFIYRLTKDASINKYLKLTEVNIFNSVVDQDLKLTLSLFENLLILDFDNNNLKVLLVNRILKLFDNFEKYDLDLVAKSLPLNNEKQIDSGSKSLPSKEKVVKENTNEQNVKENQVTTKIDEEMLDNVFNVLVQAQIDVRKIVKAKWLKINQLIESNKFRNFSKIYLGTEIKAASDNAIVLVCDNIIQADLINKTFTFQEQRKFLSFLLTKEYMIYALDKSQWKLVGQKYQELSKNNQLPIAKPVIITEAKIKDVIENKSQALIFLQNIFSEIEEI